MQTLFEISDITFRIQNCIPAFCQNMFNTYKLAGRCSRFPLSSQVTHASRNAVKRESSVALKVNFCTEQCAICDTHKAVGW